MLGYWDQLGKENITNLEGLLEYWRRQPCLKKEEDGLVLSAPGTVFAGCNEA